MKLIEVPLPSGRTMVQLQFETPEHWGFTQVTPEQWTEIVGYVEGRYIRRVRGDY